MNLFDFKSQQLSSWLLSSHMFTNRLTQLELFDFLFCIVKPSRFFADAIYDIYQYFDLDGFCFLLSFCFYYGCDVVWLVSGFVTAWHGTVQHKD